MDVQCERPQLKAFKMESPKASKKNVNADALSRHPLVLPTLIASKEKQQKILQEMHECPIGGHQGIQRTYDRLKLCYMAGNVQ
jgi:hypothetical protein